MPRRPNIVQQSAFENNNSCNMAVETEKTNACEDTMLMDTSMNECDSQLREDGLEWTPKMNRSGGGRRKQSKPIRVFMDVDGEQPPGQGLVAPVPDGKENIDGTIPQNCDLVMDVDEPYKDDLCSDTYQTQSALTDHIPSVHEIRAEEEHEPNFPTKYHRLGSELQQGVNLVTGKGDLDEGAPELQHSPQNHEECNSNSDNQGAASADGSKGSRIFHQDAYCELCDREFCNKYFLKTHKANKHGIYDNASSTSSSSPSLTNNVGPPFAPLPRLEELPAMSLPVSLPPKLPKVPSPTLSLPTTTSPASLVPSVTTPSKPVVTSSQGMMPTTPAKPAPDMEDYCEICQKHFCNKYYLKKHKHDVHGIVPENAPSLGNKRGRPSTLGSSLSGSSSSSSSSSTACPPLLLPHNTPITSANLMNGAGAMPGLNSMGNFMFINPFAQPVLIQAQPSLQPNLQPLPAGLVPQPLGGLPQVPHPPTTPDSIKTSLPSSTSPTSVQLPTDPLRALGGQGQEVTCELCRKEFCNKYFLKLHKAHKHGIYYDDVTGMGPVLLPPGLGAASESLSLCGPEPGETTPDGRDKSASRLTPEKKEILSDETCEICHKEFSNRYSLRVHLINAHNVKPHDFDITSISSSISQEIMKVEKLNGGQNLQGTMFGNMIAAKLADRVMCDICNKEVCNKYFLKTHKIKVHGIDPSQLDKERDDRQNVEKQNPLNLSASANMPKPEHIKPETVVRPNDDELLKMGIDPEAYCEICKKEFCSKYFLKTHKLNIHGIKSEYKAATPSPATPEKKPMTTIAPLITPPGNLRQSPVQGPILQIPAPPLLHNENSDNSTESGKWKWKEPVNATRVICDICSKELCNKYFLKTHLLNKHGIYYDIATGQASAPTKIPGIPSRLSSGKVEIKNVNESSVASTGSASDAASLPGTGMDGDKSENSADNVVSAKTWQIPPEGVKEEKTHNGDQAPDEFLKTTDGEFYIQKCDICGMIFGEKVTLQLHMIRDHQGQVTVRAEDSSSQEYRRNLATTLGMSLKRKYQRTVKKKANQRSRLRRFGSSVVAGIGEKVKSAIVNHIQNHQRIKKKYRCAHCQERFFTRGLCQTHIRAEHGHIKAVESAEDSQGSQSKSTTKPLRSRQLVPTNGNHNQNDEEMDTKESPPAPKLPACHAVPSKLSNDSQVIMQSFTLEEKGDDDHFAASVVYLPVFHKISEPISTTFTLTPTKP